jgi:hypothetical protein
VDIALTFIIGLLLRLGIPIALSVLIFALLHRLDEGWKKEALALPVVPAGKRCWEIKDCSEEKKKNCPAAANKNLPCWQVFRTKDGVMKEACLECDVFRQAPLPAKI